MRIGADVERKLRDEKELRAFDHAQATARSGAF